MVIVAQQQQNRQLDCQNNKEHQQYQPHSQHQKLIRDGRDDEEKNSSNDNKNFTNHLTDGDVDEEQIIAPAPVAVDTYSLDDVGYGTEIGGIDENLQIQEDSSSTRYSEVDDSLFEGDDLGSWSCTDNGTSVSSSVQQQFDNGVVLPVSEVPSFGDVCVKNSANVHFGNKTFYNGPVTIKQIVYANPNVCEDGSLEDIINASDRSKVNKTNGVNNFNGNSQRHYSEGDKFSGDAPQASKNDGDDHKASEWCSCLLTWRCVALMCAMGSCLVAAVVVSVVLLSRDSDLPPTPVFPEIPDSSLDGTGLPLGKLRFVERDEWGAQPPTEPLQKLKHPVPYVFISHTATDFCKTQSECVFRVRFAQTFHIESRNWSDIGYSFLVGGDGYAYVGRSWDFVGAHTYDYNNRSIGISFIGTFNSVVPPKHQLHAVQQLIELGVKAGKISPDYKLLGHRQVSKTLSPGDALYNVIKTWPNWSPTP